MNSAERREAILKELKAADKPVSATALANLLSVSRQIIVGDVALLRAAGADIAATARGYVMDSGNVGLRRVACCHAPEEMRRELELMVDYGCVVEDVIVEHAVYGEITGRLDLSSRYDVGEFIRKVSAEGAKPLSDLTGGIHLHTLRCSDSTAFEQMLSALRNEGFLVEDENTVHTAQP